MVDFLKEALHAPLGTIFVLAGLAFVGIAIIGKISGKIEPDKFGRIAGGVVGAGLVIVGLFMHAQEAQTHSGTSSQDQGTNKTTDTHSGNRGTNPVATPKVYTEGQIVIRGTWSCDLDAGSETTSGADFFWEQVNGVERYLVPRGGARFSVLGRRDFHSVSYADLTKLNYSEDKINASNATYNRIPQGTVVAAVTNEGRHSKFLITEYGYNLGISWVTYDK